MAIVATYKIGNTICEIDDEIISKQTPEEREKVELRIAAVAWKIVLAARAAGKDI